MTNAADNHGNVSIKDVAELAQVSIATVSRVINGESYVSDKTRQRVQKAIERCGYVPNMAARGMRTRHMPIIGFLVANVKNEYFSDLTTNLQRLFLERGYFLIICTTNDDPQVEQASVSMLTAQGVSGIVAISRNRMVDGVPHSMPLVCIDCLPPQNAGERSACVESNNRVGGYQATMELIEKGCREIVLLTGPEDAYTSRKRAEGYLDALVEKGIPLELSRVFHFEEFNYTAGEEMIDRLYASGVSFDGIFGICDYVVQGSLDALARRGVDVPGEIRVVGFDDLYVAQCNGKKMTTVHQCSERVAEITRDLMLEMIAGNPPSQKHVVVPTYLVRRETT